jgi:hypothetical protein
LAGRDTNFSRTAQVRLEQQTAERRDGAVLVRCEASLDNATDNDQIVHSGFFSAFDGLELVVTTRHGKTLAQQLQSDVPAILWQIGPIDRGYNQPE